MRTRLLAAGAAAGCAAAPALGLRFPPLTDLPQHLDQARMLLDVWRGLPLPVQVNFLTPYWGAQALLAPLAALLPAPWLPQAAVLVLALLWTGSLHALGAFRGREPLAALAASALFFNQSLGWGFLPFLAGWPAFLLWIRMLEAPSARPARTAGLAFAGALLLYALHALWFAAGLLLLAARILLRRPGWRAAAAQAAGVAPLVLLAAWWFPRMDARHLHAPPQWFRGLGERLSPSGLASAAFGNLPGALEGWILAFLAAWMALGLLQARKEGRQPVDRVLLLPALLLLALALLLPDKHSNTIFLAERFMPGALALLLLALPAPRLDRRALAVAALLPPLILAAATARAWHAVAREEMAGLGEALEALPAHARVLGLVYVRESRHLRGRPFLQAFAYAGAMKGASLNFSLASLAPSTVAFRDLGPPPWTPGLEWNPERATSADLDAFTHVLVCLPEEGQRAFAEAAGLRPLTRGTPWRLYEGGSLRGTPGRSPGSLGPRS